jgi:hypothetical protein
MSASTASSPANRDGQHANLLDSQEVPLQFRQALGFCGSLVLIGAVLTSPAWCQAPAKEAAPLIVGRWKLNAEKSNMRVPPDYLELRQYSMRPDGFLVGLLIQGTPQQGYHWLQFTAKSDGKDYPEYSDAIVADMIAAGRPTSRSYSETIVDEYVTNWVDKVNGKVTAQGKKTISKDGKTMTITVDGNPTQVRIYDRQ